MSFPNAFDAAPAELRMLAEDMRRLPDEARRVMGDFARESFTGSALEGGVTATVSGLGALREIAIHPQTKRYTDNHTLGDAVVEAVRRAEAAAKEAMADRLTRLTRATPGAEKANRDFLPGAIGGA